MTRTWALTGTGGGCTALRTEIPASVGYPIYGRYALLTNGDAQAPDEQTTEYVIGLYVNEEDPERGDDYIAGEAFSSREECEAWLAERLAES